MIPPPIKNLADKLSELPSIGPRQAIRLAFHIASWESDAVSVFARTLLDLQNIKPCRQCFLNHQNEGELCGICSNEKRRADLLAIVEKETDLMSLEKSGAFGGRYFIIGDLKRGGVLDEYQKTRLIALKTGIKKMPSGICEEIILAINPTTYGDLSSAIIARELSGYTKKISRLGRGIPTGGEIEFADEETMKQAIERRT